MKIIGLKRVYLFFTSIVLFVLHLPFVFAKSVPVEKAVMPSLKGLWASPALAEIPAHNDIENIPAGLNMYDTLRLGTIGLAKQAYENAVKGFSKLVDAGKIANQSVISIIDFTKPSSQKRLFVIDIRNRKVLYHTYVAHGINSGREMASQFSNEPESNKSSLGFYKTESTYMGKNGYSLHLIGLEKGINDNAYSRDIVMHGADYVNEDYIRSQGFIGRSWGCPAVSMKESKPIIDHIKNGTCLYIFGNDKNYSKRTRIL